MDHTDFITEEKQNPAPGKALGREKDTNDICFSKLLLKTLPSSQRKPLHAAFSKRCKCLEFKLM